MVAKQCWARIFRSTVQAEDLVLRKDKHLNEDIKAAPRSKTLNGAAL